MDNTGGSMVDEFVNDIRREAINQHANIVRPRNRNETKSDEDSSSSEDEAFQRIMYQRVNVDYRYTGYTFKLNEQEHVIWYDTGPGKRPCYRLVKFEDFREIDDLGRETFFNLKTNISPRDVGRLMLLAYNLVGPDDVSLFGTVDEKLIDPRNYISMDRMDSTPLRSGRVIRFSFETILKGSTIEDMRQRAIGYCYLAASYFRMYTKSSENYLKIEKHLQSRFKNFYAFDFPFSSFHPDKETVVSIKSIIETHETLRNTFYNFLYAGEVVSHGKNVKGFLYSLHVTLTGMHAYQLFLKCMLAYKCTNADLTRIFNTAKFSSEIKAISFIFTRLFHPEEGIELQMWRYARIFDPKYLSALQTKNCVIFTYALATLYKHGTRKADGTNVFKIVQLEDISYNDKVTAKLVAKRAEFLLRRKKQRGLA